VKTKVIRIAATALLCSQLSGCFFIFIPGSLIRKASDAVTGSEGENCVTSTAQVGDHITLVDGSSGTVASLSGKSVICKEARFPIRARIEFDKVPRHDPS